MTAPSIECHVGEAMSPYIPDIARLRIEVFRDFPYLYQGDMDYEANYLKHFASCPQSIVVIARNTAGEVVGASTGMPLAFEDQAFKAPIENSPWPVETFFYCAESVLQRRYRGCGLGVAFFKAREAHALALGGFQRVGFCAVQRASEHPLRPAHYQPLDAFWQKRGYTAYPKLTVQFAWTDVGDSDESAKTLMFWSKPLDTEAH